MHIQIAQQNTHRSEISEDSWEVFLGGTYRACEGSTGQLVIPGIRIMEAESVFREATRPGFYQYANLRYSRHGLDFSM